LKKAKIKAKIKANLLLIFSPYFSLGSRLKKADKAEHFFDSIFAFHLKFRLSIGKG